MSNICKIELSYQGIGNNILRSEFMQEYMDSIGADKAEQSGNDYGYKVDHTGQRYVARVFPKTSKAKKDNLKNNTLLKTMNKRI